MGGDRQRLPTRQIEGHREPHAMTQRYQTPNTDAVLALCDPEIAAIEQALPASLEEGLKRQTLEHVMGALQAFAREKPIERKPNIRAEISKLKKALDETVEALDEASEESRFCLAEPRARGEAPTSLDRMKATLQDYASRGVGS